MANVLSQDEVDSLLGGIAEGKVQTETAIPESEKKDGLEVYDFGMQAGPAHLRMPALGIINERFVGFLRASMSAATALDIDVNIASVDSVKFGEFCRSIPVPASLNIFKMDPLRGFALIVLEGQLVFTFVDALFGGRSVSHVKLEGKTFTTIERKIIEKIVKIILVDLQKAWSDVHKLKMVFTRSEIDPQFAAIATPDDLVIATKLMIDLQNVSGRMTICIPYSTLEPIRGKLKQRFQREKLEVDQKWKRYITEKVKELTINLSCAFGKAGITGREVLKIKVGDVIQLDKKMSDPVIVSVEGVPKFIGYPGTFNKRKAIKIKERVNKELNYG